MTFKIERDLDSVKINQHAKCLHESSIHSKVTTKYTDCSTGPLM